MKKHLKALLIGAGIAVTTMIGMTVGLSQYANRQSEKTIAIAGTYLSDLNDAESNDTVKRLDALLTEMEIGPTAVYSEDQSTEKSEADPMVLAPEVSSAANDYFSDELLKLESGPLPELPAVLSEYVNTETASLVQIKTLLNEHPLPVWRLKRAYLEDPDYAYPSHMNTVKLHQLLLAKAIVHMQAGEAPAAQEYLQASGRLHDGLAAGPLALNDLLAMIMGRSQLIVTRLGLPARQIDFQATDYAQSMQASMELDNWIFSRAMLQKFVDNSQSGGPAAPEIATMIFPRFFPATMMQLAVSDRNQVLAQNFQQLAQQDFCKLHEMSVVETAAWNPLKMKYDLSLDSFSRTADMQLTAELNSLVAQAHRQFEADNQWPDTLDDLNSKTCIGEQWLYEKRPEGITIRYGGETPWRTEGDYQYWPALTYRFDQVS